MRTGQLLSDGIHKYIYDDNTFMAGMRRKRRPESELRISDRVASIHRCDRETPNAKVVELQQWIAELQSHVALQQQQLQEQEQRLEALRQRAVEAEGQRDQARRSANLPEDPPWALMAIERA